MFSLDQGSPNLGHIHMKPELFSSDISFSSFFHKHGVVLKKFLPTHETTETDTKKCSIHASLWHYNTATTFWYTKNGEDCALYTNPTQQDDDMEQYIY